jgi:uncharacterized protein DUF6880
MASLGQGGEPGDPMKERQVIGWGSGGPIYADQVAARSHASTVRLALQEIADVQGDVDAFIRQYAEQTRKVPKIAASIAQRLLAAGRAEESMAVDQIDRTKTKRPDFEWEDARIAVLDALGRGKEAQACRWSCFENTLSAPHLRAYLKRLPDFDDLEAEKRAHRRRPNRLLRVLDHPAFEVIEPLPPESWRQHLDEIVVLTVVVLGQRLEGVVRQLLRIGFCPLGEFA